MPHRTEIVTLVEIAASPARVWDVLTRFGDYPAWNAFLPEVTGELRWKGRLIPGLFSGEHVFLLEPLAGGTRLVQRERFRGLLLPLMRGMLDRGARAGFEQMNRALKARAEGA